jgi:hypothetical protein
MQSIQQSERSDAETLIISEVDGFGQTGTSFSPLGKVPVSALKQGAARSRK